VPGHQETPSCSSRRAPYTRSHFLAMRLPFSNHAPSLVCRTGLLQPLRYSALWPT
jgi:hypothetical protein